MPADTQRVVLVETSDALPGLLPFQAWDVLGTADAIAVRDASAHPSAPHLYAAGLDLTTVEPATLDREDMNLARPGSPDDRRIAKALLAGLNDTTSAVIYLLGPDDAGLAAALAGLVVDRDVEIELVFFAPQPAGTELVRAVDVMARLRDPDGGCPWDLEQDHQSLVKYLIEETYELVDAIEQGEDVDLAEELGDVLLQVLFHAQIANERRAFTIDDVARGIVDKLVRRHPHVFSDGDAETAADVQANWDELKAVEKGRTGVFDGVPSVMPALALIDKLQAKAVARDAQWAIDDPSGMVRDIADRLNAAERSGTVAADIGALAEALVAVARAHDIDPEAAARDAARQFRSSVDAWDARTPGDTASDDAPDVVEGDGDGDGLPGTAG